MSDKKYNITEQDIQIAERLKSIFEKRKKEAKASGIKFSQETVALACGWTQGAIGHYLNAKMPINFSAASKLANALNVSIADFAPSLASQITAAPITPYYPRDGQTLESMNIRPVVDMDETDLDDDEFEYLNYREVFVSGGSKELPILESDTEPCKMKKEIARRAGADMEHTFGYTLEGDSMYPKILDKAHCVGDSSKKQVKDGKIYCFRHGVMRRTKYLFNRPDGGLLIRSENREEYPDEIVKPEDMYDIEILGWVYNWCNTEVW